MQEKRFFSLAARDLGLSGKMPALKHSGSNAILVDGAMPGGVLVLGKKGVVKND
jgi:hypothetical protein